ncbi:MAG: metal-dependent transcriptional regulator [Acidobacteriota bacterium]|nr:metal-dependent transcriptional regulator [Acidobacteriota bacterium]
MSTPSEESRQTIQRISADMISQSMQDYLKAIYKSSSKNERVATTRLADKMGCSAASVTNMLQKLSALKLVLYEPYQGVLLTEGGQEIALEIIRHHRLIELYLKEVLGYSWDKVHDEAEKLEHFISEEFEDKIDEALGYPRTDPHGDPIPTKEEIKDGQVDQKHFHSLWEIADAKNVRVCRVSDSNPEVLQYLDTIGVFPDVELSVLKKAPFNGPVDIKINTRTHSLSEELARQIFVVPA